MNTKESKFEITIPAVVLNSPVKVTTSSSHDAYKSPINAKQISNIQKNDL